MGCVVNYLTRSDEVTLQCKMVAMKRLMIHKTDSVDNYIGGKLRD